MSNTLPSRLRAAAQYTGLDSMRELLIEAAGALERAEPVAWLESEPSTRYWPARDLFFGIRSCAYSSRMHFGEKPNVMPDGNRLTPLYTTPQPQERKPLSEWQIVDIVHAWGDGKSLADLMRAVEAAHGIKE